MNQSWWELPGPKRFAEEIARDCREGGVLLAVPRFAPAGLADAIRESTMRGAGWGTQPVRINGVANHDPIAVLGSLSDDSNSRHPHDVRSLCRGLLVDPGSRGIIFWVEGITPQSWAPWQSFVRAFCHLRRNASDPEAPSFCVLLEGALAVSPIVDAGLTSRFLRGASDRLDMALYLSPLIADPHPARRRMLTSIAVELAGTDPQLGAELASLHLSELLHPAEFLRGFAKRRGWTERDPFQPTWHEGTQDDLDGEPFVHSAALARHDADALAGRLWAGQVSVLFPLIERHRLRLLQQVREHLSVPVETPFGSIDDVRDLEIGQIQHQLRKAPLTASRRRLINCLASIRRSLAHLEPVGGALLNASPEFWRLPDSGC